MYLEHFGFSELPFTLTPNTRFLVNLPNFREAICVLDAALYSGEGFIKVVGEVGTGKSMLCRQLLHSLDQSFITAYVPNPELTGRELLRVIAEELGLDPDEHALAHDLTTRIGKRLIELRRQRRQVVLVVDEAQVMPDATLETLRLLTNFETESSKLLQVVLLGQPELDERLARPQLRQLRQRITVPHRLRSLEAGDTRIYVRERIWVAGCARPALFSKSALSLIHGASRGLPRLINILAHKSLLSAYGAGSPGVRRWDVKRAIDDTADAEWSRMRGWGRRLSRFGADS